MEVGRRREQHARVGVHRLVVDGGDAAHLDDLARVHHRRAIADLGDDRQVVGDEHHRHAELLAERRSGRRAARGSAPAPSRRAPSSARRRATPSASRRAPSRSQPAAASHRRTRADSGRRGRRGSRRARAARATRAFASHPSAEPCSSIGSAICSPIVFTGLNAFIAPWKTIEMSFQRCGLTDSSPRDEDVLAVEQHLARDRRGRGQEPHHREDRRRLAAAGLADEPEPRPLEELEADALHGVELPPPGRSNQTCRSSTAITGCRALIRTPASRAAAAPGTGARRGGRPGAAG